MGLKHFIFIGVYNWHILKIQMVRVIVRVHIYYPAPFAQHNLFLIDKASDVL